MNALVSPSGKVIMAPGGGIVIGNSSSIIAPTCDVPGIPSASPTDTTAVVSWAVSGDAVTYELRYKLASSGTWTTVTGIAGSSYNLSSLTPEEEYDIEVRSNCGSNSFSSWVPGSFTTQATPSGDIWTDTVTGSTQVFDIDPTDFPAGDISSSSFLSYFPNLNQHKTFISDPRITRKTAPNGLPALRFWDPVCRDGENRNPYYRRLSFYNDGLDSDNFADAGLPNGADEVAIEFGLYMAPHTFTGTDADKDMWTMGKHSKWLFGVSGDNGFANTGGNVQPDGEFEVVWTHYSALISNEDAKGDFPHATISNTDFDYAGAYAGRAYSKSDRDYVEKWGHPGLGIYSADPRHSYNYEEQIWPVFPGTNIRRPYTVGVYYEWRVVVKLDDQGQDNGEIHWWWREDGGTWQKAATVTGWRARGTSNVKIRRIGPLGMFNGGWGWGWSHGDTDEYPFQKSTEGGSKYDRGYFITYFRAWGK